jgi:hypothetical protein
MPWSYTATALDRPPLEPIMASNRSQGIPACMPEDSKIHHFVSIQTWLVLNNFNQHKKSKSHPPLFARIRPPLCHLTRRFARFASHAFFFPLLRTYARACTHTIADFPIFTNKYIFRYKSTALCARILDLLALPQHPHRYTLTPLFPEPERTANTLTRFHKPLSNLFSIIP